MGRDGLMRRERHIEMSIDNYKKLKAWQKSHEIVLRVYLTTKTFPKSELFGLISQMRRCAVSVASNIAEGFNRRSGKDKVRFYSISQGSIAELGC